MTNLRAFIIFYISIMIVTSVWVLTDVKDYYDKLMKTREISIVEILFILYLLPMLIIYYIAYVVTKFFEKSIKELSKYKIKF